MVRAVKAGLGRGSRVVRNRPANESGGYVCLLIRGGRNERIISMFRNGNSTGWIKIKTSTVSMTDQL